MQDNNPPDVAKLVNACMNRVYLFLERLWNVIRLMWLEEMRDKLDLTGVDVFTLKVRLYIIEAQPGLAVCS